MPIIQNFFLTVKLALGLCVNIHKRFGTFNKHSYIIILLQIHTLQEDLHIYISNKNYIQTS